MRILDRYIAQDFLKLFCLALGVLLALSVLVHLFERLHRYVYWGASAFDVMAYYFYVLPKETLRIAPVALMIAAFLSVGRLSRNFEFLAMQMARLHPLRVVLPVMALAVAITAGLYGIQEQVAPKASETAFRILHQRIRKSSRFYRTRKQDIWYLAGANRILHIGLLETGKGKMHEVSMYQFSSDFVLRQRLEAVTGRWQAGQWILGEVRIRRFLDGGTTVSVTKVPEMPIQLNATPKDLARVEKTVEEMSYGELKRYIKRLSRSGVDAHRYVADLLAKPALLAANVVMAILGIVFAFRVGRQGLYIHVGTCIATAFLYWLLFSIALPLARNDVLPPVLAVWLPNMIFGSIALLGLARAHPRI